jgi:hypothetical protein
VLASPQFTPSPVYAGTVNLGNTQYADAMQRGNFWNNSRTKPDYHILLKPEVYPTQTVVVPAALGAEYTDYPSGIPFGIVYEDPNNSYRSPIDTFISSFVAQVQDPSALLISSLITCWNAMAVVWAITMSCRSPPAWNRPTYTPTTMTKPFSQIPISARPSPISTPFPTKFLNGSTIPFGDNIVPAWSAIPYPSPFCSEKGYLEVADPVEFLPQHALSYEVGGVTWHPYDIVFLPWFEQASSSTSEWLVHVR